MEGMRRGSIRWLSTWRCKRWFEPASARRRPTAASRRSHVTPLTAAAPMGSCYQCSRTESLSVSASHPCYFPVSKRSGSGTIASVTLASDHCCSTCAHPASGKNAASLELTCAHFPGLSAIYATRTSNGASLSCACAGTPTRPCMKDRSTYHQSPAHCDPSSVSSLTYLDRCDGHQHSTNTSTSSAGGARLQE